MTVLSNLMPIQLTATFDGLGDTLQRLRVLNCAPLRAVGIHCADVARAIDAARQAGEPAVAILLQGWSAVQPRLVIRRLLTTAEQTAVLLYAQSRAIESTCIVIDQAKADAERDMASCLLELAQAQHVTPNVLASLLPGAQTTAAAARTLVVLQITQASLTRRLTAVEVAVESLGTSLAGDPTTGPDGLRAGPDAVLPPDPVLNPANRRSTANLAKLAADLHSGDWKRASFADSIQQSLRQACARAGTAQLLVYDPVAFDGQGRAAISVGNLTTAKNVAVVVPGISNSPRTMAEGITLAGDLRDESMKQAPGQSTAVVAWYGYDMPLSADPGASGWNKWRDRLAAGSAVTAVTGAPVLAADLRDIKAMTPVADRTTLLGFSMGSTTVSEAAHLDVAADSIVLMGSPGAGWDVPDAAHYPQLPAEDVYTLSYDQDPVTQPITDNATHPLPGSLGMSEPYGHDPADQSFGGNHIDAVSNMPTVTIGGLPVIGVLGAPLVNLAASTAHHSMKNYMSGPALVAEGSIVVGNRRKVPTKRGR